MKTLDRLRDFANPEAQKFADDLVNLWNDAVKARIFHAGRDFENVELSAVDREIVHNLGYVPTRVIEVYKSTNAFVFVGAPHAKPRTHINIRASKACVVNLVIA